MKKRICLIALCVLLLVALFPEKAAKADDGLSFVSVNDYLPPEEARLIHLLMRMDYPNMHLFRLTRHDRHRIVSVLLSYYRLHIPQFPELKSLQVLKELWGD